MANSATIHSPLLSQEEIKALIQGAYASRSDTHQKAPYRGRSGNWQSPMQGSGSDFSEVRAYHPGDDPRRIDWRATARSRSPLLRTYHAELNRSFYLLIDRTASMRFGTRKRLKVTQALRAALWLAGIEIRTDKEIAAIILDSPAHWLPPQRGMRAIKTLLAQANQPCPPIEPQDNAFSWKQMFSSLRQRLPQGSELIMLSDFNLLDMDKDKAALNALGHHCNVQSVHIFDPAEQQLPLNQHLQLSWGNIHQQIAEGNTVTTHQLAQAFKTRTRHLTNIMHTASISYVALSTQQDNLSDLIKDQG